MPGHKRTEVTIETERVVTIRRRRSLRVWCRTCGCAVDAIGVEEAGALVGMKKPNLTTMPKLLGGTFARVGTGKW